MNLNSIYAVIVLYNCSLKESSTAITIIKALDKVKKTLDVLVYDNSSISQYKENTFNYYNLNCQYIHNSSNPGLAEAYNRALYETKRSNKQWLLLLDQDTHFSINYFTEIYEVKFNNIDIIGALIPSVASLNGKVTISPMKMKRGGLVRNIENVKAGILKEQHITGINSGTLLSLLFLKEIKQFDTRFPLDMLDHWYFKELQKKGYHIYLLNTTIYQELSIHNMESQMSIDRYVKMLKSEKLFIKNSLLDKFIFKFRLVFRLYKQLSFKDKSFFCKTLENIFK